jgi:peptidoglycan/LPS O-acetylase OafA/YrhL
MLLSFRRYLMNRFDESDGSTRKVAERTDEGGKKLLPDAATGVFHFQHIPELDGFRGLAVLVVLAGHYLDFRMPDPRPEFATIDKLGVLLFFVLSGFLITGLLYRERNASGSIDFKRFYFRRILRLAPALLLFLATVTILIRLGWITDVPRREILECLLYARNLFGRSLSLSHIWSLSLEEQFYLIWPLAFSLLPMKRCTSYVTAICVALAGWRSLAIAANLFSYERGIFYMRPYFRFDSILIGACLVLWLSTSPRAVEVLKKWLARIPAVLLWSGLLLWTVFAESLSHAFYLTVQEFLVAAALAQIVLSESEWLRAIFRWRPLRYCGAISYSLYLWQQLFLVTAVPSWGALRRLPLSILVPFLIAAASYHLMEKPLLGLKNRLAPQS